jgi:hypothetical protein
MSNAEDNKDDCERYLDFSRQLQLLWRLDCLIVMSMVAMEIWLLDSSNFDSYKNKTIMFHCFSLIWKYSELGLNDRLTILQGPADRYRCV